jgi:16S rRNA processing protein RimM
MSILLPVGKVSKLFGLDGGVLINLYDSFSGNIDKEEPLFVKIDGLAVPLFVEYFERRGQKGALIRFEDIDTPVRAEELSAMEIFIMPPVAKKGSLWRNDSIDATNKYDKDDDEIFFDDLVGYRATVAEEVGRPVEGIVTAFIDSEFNPLLQIETGGRELLIPAADHFIDNIDTTAREISFIVPSGLLELYL